MAADRLIGACLVVAGILIGWGSTQIAAPMLGVGDPGPRLLPMTLGILIAGLGALLAIRQSAAPAPVDAEELDDADTATLIPAETPLLSIVHAVNLIAYVMLFERLGFTASTFIFLSIAIFLLGPRTTRGAVIAVMAAALVSLVVGTGLRLGVGVPLPGVLFG
jgi:hypothetical protein